MAKSIMKKLLDAGKLVNDFTNNFTQAELVRIGDPKQTNDGLQVVFDISWVEVQLPITVIARGNRESAFIVGFETGIEYDIVEDTYLIVLAEEVANWLAFNHY